MCDMNAIDTHVRAVALADSSSTSVTALLNLLARPEIREGYLLFCFAVLLLPVIGLTFWYHGRIQHTEGGRRLMERHNRSRLNTKGTINEAARSLRQAETMGGDIERGIYGAEARAMQHKVYWVAGLWMLASAAAFGLLIWADDVNKAAGLLAR